MNYSQAVVLTGAGATAIAVVRIDGALVGEFLTKHFRGKPRLGRCVHGVLMDGEKVLDDPVVVMMGARRADINLHGGPWVVASVMQLLERFGFAVSGAMGVEDEAGGLLDEDAGQWEHRPRAEAENHQKDGMADEGDGEKREDFQAAREQADDSWSHENGLDWTDGSTGIERQMIASLPAAPTELALRVMLAQPRAWENLAAKVMGQSRAQRRAVIEQVMGDRSLYNLMRRPRVAIVGAPNVGKSTLANRLFAVERSITADLPGTTRDWVGEVANIDGLAVMLVDTPGIRQTEDPIEREAIDKSGAQIRTAELVVLVLDAQRLEDTESQRMRERFSTALRVINKVDLVEDGVVGGAPEALAISAMRDEGVDAVREAILEHFGCARLEPERARWWREEQVVLLHKAIDEPELLSELVRRVDD